jgi:hypothetical protein
MPGADNYTLTIEGQARGSAEIEKLNRALAGTASGLSDVKGKTDEYRDSAEKAGKATADFVGGMLGSVAAAKAVGIELLQLSTYATAHAVTTEKLVNSYRLIRLALSPTLFTAGTIGIGILTEKYISLLYSQGKLIEQNALLAAKTNLTVREVETLGSVSRATGQSSTFLADAVTSLNKQLADADSKQKTAAALKELGLSLSQLSSSGRDSVDNLGSIAFALGRLEDPAAKARIAFALFGEETAEKILPSLNEGLTKNLRTARDWELGLSDTARAMVTKFKSDMDSFLQEAQRTFAELKLSAEKARKEILEVFAAAGQAPQTAGFRSLANATKPLPSDEQFKFSLQSDNARLLANTQNNLAGGLLSATQGGAAVVDQIRAKFANSLEGLQAQQQELQKQRSLLTESLDRAGKGALSDVDRALANTSLISVSRALQETDRRIESIKDATKKAEDEKRAIAEFARKREELRELIDKEFFLGLQGKGPLSVKPLGKSREDFGDLASSQVDFGLDQLALGRIGRGDRDAITGRGTDSVLALEQQRKNAKEDTLKLNERAIRASQQEVDFQARKIELLAGPGGEVDAVNKITQLRLNSLEQQKALTEDTFNLELEQVKIREDRELRILTLKKEQREQARNAGEALFDATLAGGGGLRQFALNQFLAPGRKIAGNAAVELFGNSIGKLQLPGLTGTNGQPNAFGRLLAGTPFGIDPLKSATDLNTQATIANTQALLSQGSTGAGLAGLIGTGKGGALGKLGGFDLSKVFGGVSTSGISTFDDSALNRADGTRNLDLIGLTSGIPINSSATTTGFTLAKGLGVTAAVGAGAFGAYSGFKSGGAQGALTGTASLAGTGASILALSGVAGPAAPILAGVGLALGVVSSLLGDPKKKRASEIDSALEGRRYTEPESVDIFESTRGDQLYYDGRGNLKGSGSKVTYNITNNIQAMDAQSFEQFLQTNTGALDKGISRLVADGGGSSIPAISQAIGTS